MLTQEWSLFRSEAKQEAFSNGQPKSRRTGGGGVSSDEEGDQPFTTNDPDMDRVMNLTGWGVGLGLGLTDELDSSVSSSPSLPKMMQKQPQSLAVSVGQLSVLCNS